jgi:hypothetical protein
MLGSIIALLTGIFSFLNGGLGRLVKLFQPTLTEKKQDNAKSAEDEFRAIEKGDRPKWD